MAGADVNRIAFALKEYRTTAPVEDLQVFSRHPLAVEFDYNTLFRNEADATAFGQQILSLRKIDRWNWACYIVRGRYPTLEVGQTVTLTYPRYGFHNGADFILKKIRRDAGALFDEIVLFGPRGLDFSQNLLALNFSGGEYWSNGTQYPTPNSLPGYYFERNAEQGSIDLDGGVDFFSVHTPAINGRGYHAYRSLTNLCLNSNSADLFTKVSATVTANQALAPDGTMTMDKVIPDAGAQGWAMVQPNGGFGSGTFTHSIFVKAAGYPRFFIFSYDAVSTYMSVGFDLTTGTVISGSSFGGATGYIYNCGNGIFRCVMIATTAGNYGGPPTSGPGLSFRSATCNKFDDVFTADGVSGGMVWGNQVIAGKFLDGGPIIRTAGSQITVPYSALHANIKLDGSPFVGDFHVEGVVTDISIANGNQFASIYNTSESLTGFWASFDGSGNLLLYGVGNAYLTGLSGFVAMPDYPLSFVISFVDSTNTIILGARTKGQTVVSAPISNSISAIGAPNKFNPDCGNANFITKYMGVKTGALTAEQMTTRLSALLGE